MPAQPVMIGRYFEEFTTGARFRGGGRTITEASVVIFTGLIGANNPQFLDDEYARASQFGSRVAPGPLVLSVGLAGTEPLITGTMLALLGVDNVRYRAPVRLGDTIHNEIEVAETKLTSRPDRGAVRFWNRIINQEGVTVLTFEHTLLIRSRPN
ncbi:MAG: MaoC/PaaZ C-terminal domain-containing protein [Dehalococcoidia bacterium]